MASFKIIELLRRNIVRLLTRRSGINSHINVIHTPITRILVVRPNHRLGNQLLLTPLLQEIEKLYPSAKISLLVKGNAGPTIFKSYNLERIFQLPRRPLEEPLRYVRVLFQALTSGYDIAFNVIPSSSSGRLFTAWARARFKIVDNKTRSLEIDRHVATHMGKLPVYSFRRIVFGSKSTIFDQVEPLDIKLTGRELETGHDILLNIFDNAAPTIALYTYATRDKIYPDTWWLEFYEKLKHRFPTHNLLEILPIENVSRLSFCIPTFYSKDIREIASVVANSVLFIGADSGIMHLAAASHTPTVGLFKVTDLGIYAPYGNGSLGINTNHESMGVILASAEEILAKEARRSNTLAKRAAS